MPAGMMGRLGMMHRKASRRIGKMGLEQVAGGAGGRSQWTNKAGNVLSASDVRQRGARRLNTGLAVGGGAMVLSRARNTRSAGADGLAPHSMGGTTMAPGDMMY